MEGQGLHGAFFVLVNQTLSKKNYKWTKETFSSYPEEGVCVSMFLYSKIMKCEVCVFLWFHAFIRWPFELEMGCFAMYREEKYFFSVLLLLASKSTSQSIPRLDQPTRSHSRNYKVYSIILPYNVRTIVHQNIPPAALAGETVQRCVCQTVTRQVVQERLAGINNHSNQHHINQ